jgi:outer membrane lipoprotein-sorting protein
MSRRLTALSLFAWTVLAVQGVAAQQAGNPSQWAAQVVGSGQQLSKKQVERVGQINAYFGQLTSLKGTFLQTDAENKRQRGHFYISRPGRFRFEFNPPSRVVILSDGRYVAIQDHDLNTDDRWDLSYTPFRALLQKDVDLLRDARILELQEAEDTITIAFEDKAADASNRITLFLASKPALQLKGWITKDQQGLDTRVDLTEMQTIAEPDARLFDPALRLERQR